MIIGTGVDIAEVRRLRVACQKWGDAFLGRVFTKGELNNAKQRGSLYQHLAGRFAAKEAVFKALGDKNLGWHDVEILNDGQGKPFCKILNRKGRLVDVHISISHVKTYAVANAIITPKKR
jgi:holo-[acyl-carrier protein] synthase